MKPSYTYTCNLVGVIDGDTIQVDVDLGFSVWLRGIKFRLRGLNCPEMNTPEGKAARDFTVDFLSRTHSEPHRYAPPPITAESVKVDKYGGRWDARVWVGDKCLNDALLASGHAVPMKGDAEPDDIPNWDTPLDGEDLP